MTLALSILAVTFCAAVALNITGWKANRDGTWHPRGYKWRRMGTDGKWQHREKSKEERERDMLEQQW
ncbi:MAG: hypothetical protein JWP25_6737 [Bradyrhizobium sp.]|nr:hypothetical protein [Bradyrhizobium sp.]